MANSSTPQRTFSAVTDLGHSDSQSSVAGRVDALARQSAHRTEFLRRLAGDLHQAFRADWVAIESSQWSEPMIRAGDEPSRDQPPRDASLCPDVDRSAVRALLETAAAMPIACDVPVAYEAHDGVTAPTEDRFRRGLRIELTAAPDRSAILVLYPGLDHPSATDQVRDLNLLSQYARSTRQAIQGLRIDRESPLGDIDPIREDDSISDRDGVLTTLPSGPRSTLRLFHRDLNLANTAYRIANESRPMLGCDRVTVLIRRHRRLRVSAISGVAVVDSRSNSVRAVQSLTRAAVVMARPLVLPGQQPLPPQIQEPLDRYLDETGVTSAVLLPLHSPDRDQTREGIEGSDIDPFHGDGDVLGVLVLEYFSDRAPPSIGPAITTVATEATLAVRNSLEHTQVLGLPMWRAAGKIWDSGRAAMLAAAAVMGLVLLVAAAGVPVRHYVIATGTAEPASRRQVFATVDGIVKTIHVVDGESVRAGQPLFQIESAELESQAEALVGQIQTASQRLASVRALRLSSTSDPAQSSRLALEERQLESDLANHAAQLEIVRAQQAELTVTSPIDGKVVGWQLTRRLANRPVSRGNLLVSIVNYSGPWSLRLSIPDRDSGPVLEAAQGDPKLPVRFAVATEPEASYQATLESIATAARLNESGQHVIDATAIVADASPISSREEDFASDVDPFHGDDARVGADVTAKIACGERSLLRSWFSDVFDFMHRNVLFYFR